MLKDFNSKTVGIFGAGFVGENVIKKLAKSGHRIKIASRNPYLKQNLKLLGEMGQIELIKVNIFNESQVSSFLNEVDVCINLVGILYEKGEYKFEKLHFKFPELITKIVKDKNKIKQFIHFSSLGVKDGTDSEYLQTKFRAENHIRNSLQNYVIIKPSVVFGPDDNFFNTFAKLARIFPILPIVGCEVKFQPCYVGDIGDAINYIVETETLAKTYELAGPKKYTLYELIKFMLKEIRRKNVIIPLPFGIGKFQAFFMQLAPKPILTIDQIKILESGDNIITGENNTFSDLNILPRSVESIVPTYLKYHRPAGQFTK
tara:strand:+ start:232 stop:1179 length:948 start_codon:yes stop_codon:yes gene_type:complete